MSSGGPVLCAMSTARAIKVREAGAVAVATTTRPRPRAPGLSGWSFQKPQ
ncbi:hypothetical protein [Streptomyces sp. NBC_01435]|nr:hypothetical protein [Streptomyces sp. NBC_01435]